MASRFRGLAAYQLAAELSDEIHATVSSWRYFERDSLGKQLVRAADSVGANIAESAGRWHWNEKRQFLVVARGSLYEAEHWAARAAARGLLDPALVDRFDEPARVLNGLLRKPGV
jgi:four helix bundle protein